jgi:hypothetical protein
VPLAADISGSLATTNVHFLPMGTTSGAHCPGLGEADVGHFCLYEVNSSNRVLIGVFNPTTGVDGVSKLGFGIYFDFAATGPGFSYGQWTFTAPTPGG